MMTERRIPDLWLEQYLLGELPPDRMALVEAAEKADPDVQSRLEALRSSNAAVLSQYPSRPMAADITQRLARDKHEASTAWYRSASAGWRLPVAASALAALALVIWIVQGPGVGPPSPAGDTAKTVAEGPLRMLEPGTRLKGDPALFLYRGHLPASQDSAASRSDSDAGLAPQEAGGVAVGPASAGEELLTDGSTAVPGDLIQIKYLAAGAAYGVIFSIDGRGTVTLHYPQDERGDTALQPGPAVPLQRSYELDDAPGFERFLLVTSQAPIPVAEVLSIARMLGPDPVRPLALPDGLTQRSVLLRKAGGTP